MNTTTEVLQPHPKDEEKEKWIKWARQNFNPGEKQPCDVCNKYDSVCHAHHISPLSEQFDWHYGQDGPIQKYVWLCPTHHMAIHEVIRSIKAQDWDRLEGFNSEEKACLYNICMQFIRNMLGAGVILPGYRMDTPGYGWEVKQLKEITNARKNR